MRSQWTWREAGLLGAHFIIAIRVSKGHFKKE